MFANIELSFMDKTFGDGLSKGPRDITA